MGGHVLRAREVVLKGSKGEKVAIDLGALKLTGKQKAAFDKFVKLGFNAAALKKLEPGERDLLAKIKAVVKTPPIPGLIKNALIVRFDWKWVKID